MEDQDSEKPFEASSLPILIIEATGRITFFNPQCQKLTGYTEDEVKGEVFWDLLIPKEHVEPVKELFDNLGCPKLPSQIEIPWVTKEKGAVTIQQLNNTYLYFKDRKHRFMALNEAAAKNLGTTIPDALGKTAYNFIPAHLARRDEERRE